MTATGAPWEGPPRDVSPPVVDAVDGEDLREAELSLLTSRTVAAERVRAMDDFEAAHGDETIDQPRA